MKKEIVPIVPGEEILGSPPKSKQISPSIRWCFTLNNYNEEHKKEIVPLLKLNCKMWIIGLEVGEKKGTPHFQGYCEFNKKVRPKSVFKSELFKGVHWEKAKGSRGENITYCSKSNNILTSKGVPKKVKIYRDGFLPWQLDLIEVAKGEPDERKIYWIWSREGNLRKTSFQKFLFMDHEFCILSGKGNDMKNGIINWIENKGDTPSGVVVNIPRSIEHISWGGLEEIKDMFFFSGKYEGGQVCGNPPHMFVFSNELPNMDKWSKDRYVIINIDKKNILDD